MRFQEQLRQTLVGRGFRVDSIPTSPSKTPDYLVDDDSYKYLLELKEKFPDPDKLERRNETLDAGDLYEESSPTGHNNTVSGLVSDAVTQLNSKGAPNCDFRLVWLHAQGYMPDLQIEQVRATLYGIATIVDWGADGGFSGEAYYFDESEFYRHREVLDGAVLSFSDGSDLRAQFCLNDHADRFAGLKTSSFCRSFGAGVLDPTQLQGSSILIRTHIDRKKREDMIKFLMSEYGMKMPRVMNMQHVSAVVPVPK